MKLPVTFDVADGEVHCALVEPSKDALPYKRPGVRLLFLTDVYTAPRLRHGGLAGALLAVVFAWARKNRVDLCCYAHSHPRGRSKGLNDWDLMRWYQREGFVCVKPAYHDPQEWLIWRHDLPKTVVLNEILKTRPAAVPKKNSASSISSSMSKAIRAGQTGCSSFPAASRS